jgi:hypothetical protein
MATEGSEQKNGRLSVTRPRLSEGRRGKEYVR